LEPFLISGHGEQSGIRPNRPSRRAFLSVSAVAAIAAPIVSQAGPAFAAPVGLGLAGSPADFDPALRMLLRDVDPDRIRATILRLTQFGTRHTLSSQTDPVRGIGAATAWVTEQMQGFAATSGGNMTVQQQTFVQPAGPGSPSPPRSPTSSPRCTGPPPPSGSTWSPGTWTPV
jgi:hypothetical protein